MRELKTFQARYGYCKKCFSLRYKPLADSTGTDIPCYSCDNIVSTHRIGWFVDDNYSDSTEPFGPYKTEQDAIDDVG